MDSSLISPPTEAASNQESANENSTTILSKRASFFASYRHKTVVPLEKIVEVLPKLNRLVCDNSGSKMITTKTVKELIKFPNFANLSFFSLYNIPEVFDIETFYDYLKTNKNTQILLHFAEISEEYKNRVRNIEDEIDQTENRDFIKPLFSIP
uniref:Uncharacterized protein n=1 Tax=Panagrolaimus sp. ES5 TaxID=591445 RepID=A0AC34G508_9BILA